MRWINIGLFSNKITIYKEELPRKLSKLKSIITENLKIGNNGLFYTTGVEESCSNKWTEVGVRICPYGGSYRYDRRETCNPDGASTGKYDFRWKKQTWKDYDYEQGRGDDMCCCGDPYDSLLPRNYFYSERMWIMMD